MSPIEKKIRQIENKKVQKALRAFLKTVDGTPGVEMFLIFPDFKKGHSTAFATGDGIVDLFNEDLLDTANQLIEQIADDFKNGTGIMALP